MNVVIRKKTLLNKKTSGRTGPQLSHPSGDMSLTPVVLQLYVSCRPDTSVNQRCCQLFSVLGLSETQRARRNQLMRTCQRSGVRGNRVAAVKEERKRHNVVSRRTEDYSEPVLRGRNSRCSQPFILYFTRMAKGRFNQIFAGYKIR